MNQKKINIDKKAAIWTAICIGSLCALLIFFGFKAQHTMEESGMLINFGDTETGSGAIEPAKNTPPPVKQTPPPPPPKQVATSSPKEALNTQDFEEAAAIASAKKKAEKEKKQKENQEALERQQEIEHLKKIEQEKALEVERLRQEELKRIEEARLAKEAQAEAIRQQTSNAFGKANSNAQSQGTTTGNGNQGSTNGGLDTNGNGLGTNGNWSLAGRNLIGSLPKPTYNVQKEGVVVIEIAVDKLGNVISAQAILKGSTTQDAQLWKLAKEAALKAHFNANPAAASKQIGTITYHFELH